MTSKISWTTETWNPITGCTPISEGCRNCYAKRMAQRLAGRYGYPADGPFRPGTWHGDKLDGPLRRKKPTTYFVVSMGDLFHRDVDGIDIACVFDAMMKSPHHTFIVLTKRPENMYEFVVQYMHEISGPLLPHIVLGVSVENQATADERIPWLLKTPAAKRIVSAEPLLGPVNLEPHLTSCKDCGNDGSRSYVDYEHDLCRACTKGVGEEVLANGLDAVYAGGETGPKARPCHPDWPRSLRDQCAEAGVVFHWKSWGQGHESRLIDGVLHDDRLEVSHGDNGQVAC